MSHDRRRRARRRTTARDEILADEALDFVAELHERFERAPAASCSPPARERAAELAARRHARLPRRDARDPRGRLAGRRRRRRDYRDRRVEITGPTDRKLVINALNSGARGLHGRLRGRELADLGATRSRAT